MPEVCEVVITGPTEAWLAEFVRALVADRLAACGQIARDIRSIYRWQGEIQDEAEARVAVHTRTALVPAIVERARAEHPYEVPCVIALQLIDGHPDYLEWILRETADPVG